MTMKWKKRKSRLKGGIYNIIIMSCGSQPPRRECNAVASTDNEMKKWGDDGDDGEYGDCGYYYWWE